MIAGFASLKVYIVGTSTLLFDEFTAQGQSKSGTGTILPTGSNIKLVIDPADPAPIGALWLIASGPQSKYISGRYRRQFIGGSWEYHKIRVDNGVDWTSPTNVLCDGALTLIELERPMDFTPTTQQHYLLWARTKPAGSWSDLGVDFSSSETGSNISGWVYPTPPGSVSSTLQGKFLATATMTVTATGHDMMLSIWGRTAAELDAIGNVIALSYGDFTATGAAFYDSSGIPDAYASANGGGPCFYERDWVCTSLTGDTNFTAYDYYDINATAIISKVKCTVTKSIEEPSPPVPNPWPDVAVSKWIDQSWWSSDNGIYPSIDSLNGKMLIPGTSVSFWGVLGDYRMRWKTVTVDSVDAMTPTGGQVFPSVTPYTFISGDEDTIAFWFTFTVPTADFAINLVAIVNRYFDINVPGDPIVDPGDDPVFPPVIPPKDDDDDDDDNGDDDFDPTTPHWPPPSNDTTDWTLSLDPVELYGGMTLTIRITLTDTSAVARTFDITNQTTDILDLTTTTITVPAGQLSAFTSAPAITVYRDQFGRIDATEAGLTRQAYYCVHAPPEAIQAFTVYPNHLAEGDTTVGTIRIFKAASADLEFTLAQSGGVAFTMPATATISTGEEFVSFDMTAPSGLTAKQVTQFTASRSGQSMFAEAIVYISGDGGDDYPYVIDLSPDPATIAAGKSSTLTVTLSVAPAADTPVAITSDLGIASLIFSSSVTVPAGESSATFDVVAPEGCVTAFSTNVFTATLNGSTASCNLHVTTSKDDDDDEDDIRPVLPPIEFDYGVFHLTGDQREVLPYIGLRWRNNGMQEWNNDHIISLGEIGDYKAIKRLFRLGQYNMRQYELSTTDSVHVIIPNIDEEVEVQSSNEHSR